MRLGEEADKAPLHPTMAATLDDKPRTVANRLSQMHMKYELYDLIADLERILPDSHKYRMEKQCVVGLNVYTN
jgi:hypothetical protein